MKSANYLIAFLSLFACNQSTDKEIYYYTTGEVKEEYEIDNGKRNGLARSFYLDGKLKAIGFYKNGLPDSTYIHYYANGNKQVEGRYDNRGIENGEKKFYFESGELKQIEYLNDKAKMIDYLTFNRNGARDFDQARVIFDRDRDTIKLGDYFEAKIRLGNRKYGYTDVIIGDPNDKQIFDKLRLPKEDSITSILKIEPESPGENWIEGVMLDIDFKVNGKDTTILDYQVKSFKKSIWVLPRRSS